MKKISACPSWLELSEDRTSFVFVPEKAKIVREIFQLSIGGLGSYAIAARLDRQKVAPFGRSPKWDNTTIDSMLRNRATFGEYQPKSYAGGSKKGVPVGAPIPEYYPAVIDEATFQAAQSARQRNLVVGRGGKGHNVANIFPRLTTCAYCGNSVKYHSDSESMMCEKDLNGSGCSRAAWSYKNFESSVLSFVAHPALIERLTDEQQNRMTDLVTRIRQLAGRDIYDIRLEIASLLKQVLSELRLACAGPSPSPILAEAIIRRDNSARFFEVRLWDGPKYTGFPVL